MKNSVILFTVILSHLSVSFANGNESRWPLHIYNFGGYNAFSIAEQVSMTKAAGYAGMIVGIAPKGLGVFDNYRSEARKVEGFDIHAAFYVLYDKTGNLVPNWKSVVDKIDGTDTKLWLITGRTSDKVSQSDLKQSISNFVRYANEKDVPVSLYPHNTNMIDHAEQAVDMIQAIRPLKMDLAFILCHEMRYGNAARIETVIQNVKYHIGHVVLSGSDENLDPKTMEKSTYSMHTLQPLYQGDFDMTRVLRVLVEIGYDGEMGYINHRFDVENAWNTQPSDYLINSMTTYKDWIGDLKFPKDFGEE